MTDIKRLVSDVTAAPLGEIIASVGEGVAQAQRALDDQAIQQLLALYAEGDEGARLLRESGWRPTFYTIPEAEGEIKVGLVVSGGATSGASTATTAAAAPAGRVAGLKQASLALPRVYATPVDAGYRSRYDYEGSVTASVRFRIVPVPPPPGSDRLRVVPRLTGLGAEAASARLEQLELAIELAGDVELAGSGQEAVIRQEPAAGEPLLSGEVVVVTLGPRQA
ncbi:PASTA domain-containing protein [Halomonas alkalicola]|uniref:PASTA domain-containing protein n=1 Tax=Halomonas alkalicola TaxID=1930622 RepID=UPI00265F262F|nr:PASTA domain-containing protein [Halomonas alkalicola]